VASAPMDAQHGTLPRRDTVLHYWLRGEPHAPVVACTHGASVDSQTFAPNVAALVAAGYRVLTWDLPGHGASQPMGGEFSIATAATDLLALLDHIGARRVALVGQSFGGLVAQQLQLDHPERIAAMVMLGATDLRTPLPRFQAMVQRMRPPLLRVWPEGHLRTTFAKMAAQQSAARRYVEQASSRQPKTDMIRVTRAALDAVVEGRREPRPAVPVLLLHGEQDMALAIRSARQWEASEDACHRIAVPDAGHLPNLDQPERCNELMIAFLHRHLPLGVSSHNE
jgi:3-oxoadipate enol-lactonase